ncbi:tocopherol cyclase family protein [Crocosphaera sp. Alani8]|uniref:tocopherol cyclase family protein n=1 Tax=Crocosphaera sp. Alani8 TaxID=3038952 RepID=UPI00313EE3F3
MKINNCLLDINETWKTPHSGYHWDGSIRRFFEGWYYRVTLPQWDESFAFMYSIDDPIGGKSHSGGAVQILGANEDYLYRIFPDIKTFWASNKHLALCHWQQQKIEQETTIIEPNIFEKIVKEGYQATATLNQGYIQDPVTKNYCRWCYDIQPIDGWGNRLQPQEATAGWLSFLPIFDPGWQVLMAHGRASGYIDWNGKIYEFKNAPAYSEKNWGHSFPSKWFWINCNSSKQESDLSLTAAGGIRQVLNWQESVGIIGLHYQGKFYQFTRENSQLSWHIKPWGSWIMQGKNTKFVVKIEGKTEGLGTYVRVPTADGLQFLCRDTVQGDLTIKLENNEGKTLLNATTCLAGLEVGGSPWDEDWIYGK